MARALPDPPDLEDDDDAGASVDLEQLRGPPSKTRLKQLAHELQQLGEAAVALPASRLVGLGLPERLLDAIHQFQRTRSHEGRRRQMQYIGKLMRGVDVEPLRQAVADSQLGRARDALALHRAEAWRAELIDDDDAVTRFVADHPGADVQQLRSLVRAARKDAAQAPEQRSGRAFRELFQFVKERIATGADAGDAVADLE